MNLLIIIPVSIGVIVLLSLLVLKHLRSKVHAQMNLVSDQVEKTEDLQELVSYAPTIEPYLEKWGAHRHFGSNTCHHRFHVLNAISKVRGAQDRLKWANEVAKDAEERARDKANLFQGYQALLTELLQTSGTEYREGLFTLLRKSTIREFLDTVQPNDSYEARRLELGSLFDEWTETLFSEARQSEDGFNTLRLLLSEDHGELAKYLFIIDGYEPGARTVKSVFPDDWNKLVARYVDNPSLGDFRGLKSLASGELRYMAIKADESEDVVLAKIVMAYCNYIDERGKRHVFEGDVSDRMRDKLAKFIGSYTSAEAY